jgi:hypothetical protein
MSPDRPPSGSLSVSTSHTIAHMKLSTTPRSGIHLSIVSLRTRNGKAHPATNTGRYVPTACQGWASSNEILTRWAKVSRTRIIGAILMEAILMNEDEICGHQLMATAHAASG